jgi:hypothetical protein
MQEPLLETLRNDFRNTQNHLEGLWREVLHAGISQFPLLIAHREPVSIGTRVIDQKTLETVWSFSISALEELIKKGLWSKETAKDFRQAYKDPRDFAAIMLITTRGMSLVYIPWATEDDKQDAEEFLKEE